MKTENKKDNSKLLKKHANHDWWDEISHAELASIERGLQQLKKSKGIPHEKVVKQLKLRHIIMSNGL